MHSEIYNFFDRIEDKFPIESLRDQHVLNDPVPFTIIDNFLPDDIFSSVVEDINNIPEDYYTTFISDEKAKRKESRNFVQAPLIQTLSNSFNSGIFIHWLEKITSISKLLPDPYLRGGGLNRVLSGERLGLHTDFNWNDQIQLNRKVNLLLYLNITWKEDWKGDLELWDKDNTKCVHKIKPVGNRLIFWNYEPWLIHGISGKLSCPTYVSRDSLAHFYYTSNSTWEYNPSRSKFL